MTVWYFLVYLLFPYVVFNLIWRGLRYPAYFHRWPERFGFVLPLGSRPLIWVHAVSVGEVRSSAGLVEGLLERYPRHGILVTTMTPTGADQVRSLFGDRVQHSYAPYDFPDAVARFLDRVKPEFVVVAETEFWPNTFRAVKRRSIPLLLVNVRLSAASLSGYLKVPRIATRMMRQADLVCAQTRTDAMRLRNLSVPDERIRVTGNLKFDVEIPDSLLDRAERIRQDLGQARPVWIAGSTHPGEEKRILSAFGLLRSAHEDLLLVLVPRNPERFGAVARLARNRGYSVARRTQTRGPLPAHTDVFIGDTMGELSTLYAAADIAFVGGSLVRRGGQNILEACAVGRPVVFGPHMFHFEDISAMALEIGAARQVYDIDALAGAIDMYLTHADLCEAAGLAGKRLVAQNRGSLTQTLGLMSRRLVQINPALETASEPDRESTRIR